MMQQQPALEEGQIHAAPLEPHGRHTAARTALQIGALAPTEPIYRGFLNELQFPVFGLDGTGALCLFNNAGEALLRARRWVTIEGGVLGASSTLLGPHGLKEALTGLRKGLGATVLLTEGCTRQQAVLTTVPLTCTPKVQLRQTSMSGFVWIIPCNAQAGSARNLGRLFELTPAEIALLEQLVHGAGLNEAAAALHISIHTARTHLKTIFRKTGRRTQSRLLALANRMSMIRMSDRV